MAGSIIDALTKFGQTAEFKAFETICGDTATSAIFKKLGDLEQEVVSDIYPGSKSKHLFTTNSCMIMKQCLQENRYQNPVYKGATTAYHNAAVLKKAARYALHANAAYFADQNKICEAVPGLGPEHIVHIENSSKLDLPSYYICTDPELDDEIVVSIRGTGNIADVLNGLGSLDASGMAFCGGRAHTGMLMSARRVAESVEPKLSEMNGRIGFTGHSLGAGVAILSMIQLFQEEAGVFNGRQAANSVSCWAFGAPPVMPSSDVPSWVNPVSYSFVHWTDVVPRVCMQNVIKFALAVKQVDDMSISEKDRLQYLVGSMDQKLDVRLPDVVELTQDLSQKYPAFNQVGTIICLYPNPEVSAETETEAKGSQPPVLAVQMKADQVDRILCHPAMMRNHHMSAYLETMNEALAAEPAARRCVVM
jgi:hypothetical protein